MSRFSPAQRVAMKMQEAGFGKSRKADLHFLNELLGEREGGPLESRKDLTSEEVRLVMDRLDQIIALMRSGRRDFQFQPPPSLTVFSFYRPSEVF